MAAGPPRDTLPAPPPIVVPAREEAPPEDRYVTRSVLGVGGMGEVTLVHDYHIGRDVALKQLKPNKSGAGDAHDRFAREARVQGQLEHPAVVPVYDLGRSRSGGLYFTMKRVHGTSLGDIARAMQDPDSPTLHRFTRRRLLSAFSQVCLAAHYAHERGVVHRDIKPDNIMLGNYGEVYLLDWGLAKVSGEDRPPSSENLQLGASSTQDGQILGTIDYMAPEQARGDQSAVDARADVYALGAILFELLTAQPLHPPGPPATMLAQIISGVEARPSVRAPEADVPPELAALCEAATRRDPNARLSSARALHDGIEAYLDGDRDVALRRAASQRHTDAARTALDAHDRDQPAGRAAALGEVGKALALDPGNREALTTLVHLLTNPPSRVPPEVVAAQDLTNRGHLRRGAMLGAFIYAYISVNGLFTWSLGIHDWKVFLTAHALWAAALVASVVTIVRPTYAGIYSMCFLGTLASTWVTGVYSPHVLVPALLIVHSVAYAQVRLPRLRVLVVATVCVGWTLSIFGEKLGLFPSTVRFVDGGMFLHSPVIGFPAMLTTVYLYMAILGVIILPAVVVGLLRSSYHRADLQTRLQTWQLQQLVPVTAAEPRQDRHA